MYVLRDGRSMLIAPSAKQVACLARDLAVQVDLSQEHKKVIIELHLPLYPGRETNSQPHSLLNTALSLPDQGTLPEHTGSCLGLLVACLEWHLNGTMRGFPHLLSKTGGFTWPGYSHSYLIDVLKQWAMQALDPPCCPTREGIIIHSTNYCWV